MRKARKTRLLIGAVLLAACTRDVARDATSGPDAPVRGGTVVVAGPSDFDHANPLVTADRYTLEILRYALFLPLLRYGPDLEYTPALAREWEVHDDTAVTFRLRDDVLWHDGMRTSAYDVAFTFLRAIDPATAFPNADWFSGWTGVTVVDSFTVRFSIEPIANVLAGIPFLGIAPRHLLDTVPPARMREAEFNRRPVGNGPFRFVERQTADRWVFEANPHFPETLGRPNVDRLVWRVIPESAAQMAELHTGAAHLALGPRVEQALEAAQDSAYRLVLRESRQYGFIGWNGRHAPLGDARVRRALTMAMNRERMIELLRGGYGHVATGPIGRYHWAYDEGLAPLPHAPDSARVLLRDAGIEDRNGDGTLDLASGRPFRIELKVPAGSSYNRDLAELVRSDLAEIGVRVDTRPVDWNALVGQITALDRPFQAVLLGWESDFRLSLRDLFHSDARDGPYQFAQYANPAVDSILDDVRSETERADALPAIHRLQYILRNEQPWSFLYAYPDVYLARQELRGAEMDIRGALVNVTRWWLQPVGADTK